ncbi:hypothetical protein A6R68_08181, partial [Neotoma lepida]
AARKVLSQERNPPLKLIIETGLLPKLVEFLKAFTNIASGTSEQTRTVVKRDAIQPSTELLSSHLTMCKQARWALEGFHECIHHVVATGILLRLVELLTSLELNVLTPFLRTMGNVVTDRPTDREGHQCWHAEGTGLALEAPKSSIQKEAAWAMSNMVPGPKHHICS